jgi:hypothetical protein
MLLHSSGGAYPDLRDVEANIGPKPESIHIFGPASLAQIQSGVFPWEAVRRVVNDFRYQLNEHAGQRRHHPWMRTSPEEQEEKWQRKDRALDVVRTFVKHWSSRLEGPDLFEPIGPTVADDIEYDLWALSRRQLRGRYGGGSTVMNDAASDVYRDMMVGSAELFSRIPMDIREYMVKERLRSGWNGTLHQMFGVVPTIQHAVEDFDGEVLLFSAQSDDMLSWLWGDVGVIHFLISPENLAAQKWDQARGLFEGH